MPPINNWNVVPPTSEWICDSCGQVIEDADHGWVEWLTFIQSDPEKTPRGTKIRLVHHCPHSPRHQGCQYRQTDLDRVGSVLSDVSLREFMGPDGLMRLLEMLAEDELQKEEILEIIKRIHIPRYEQARLHFERALREGIIEPTVAPGYYWQSDIEAVLESLGEAD